MDRGRALLLLLPLLTATLAGCAAYSDLQRFLDRAQGRDEFAEVTKLDERVSFNLTDAPAIPPAGPSAQPSEYPFVILEGSRLLRLDVAVRFDAPTPLPVEVPGRVAVELRAPDGSVAQSHEFPETGGQAFEVRGPEAGQWIVHVETLGQGQVRLHAVAVERVPGT